MFRFSNISFAKLIKTSLLIAILSAMITATYAADLSPITLKNSSGKEITIAPNEGEITVLEWFNKGCPFVQKFYKSGFMQKLQENYTKQNVKWYTINSTKEGHSDFIPLEKREELQKELGFKNTETLYDESGVVGKKLEAKTTPHIFIYKGSQLVYSGAVDDSPDSDSEPENSQNNIESVLNSVLKGEEPSLKRTRPYGCSIKYAE